MQNRQPISLMFDLSRFYQEAGLGYMAFLRQRKITVSYVLKEAIRVLIKDLNKWLTFEELSTILVEDTHVLKANWTLANQEPHFIPCLRDENEAHQIYTTIVHLMYMHVATTAREFLRIYLNNESRDYVVLIRNELYTMNFYTVTYSFTWINDWIG